MEVLRRLVILAVILGYVGIATHGSSAKADIWDEGKKIDNADMTYEFWAPLERGQLKLLHSSKDKKGVLHSVFWAEQKGILSCYTGYDRRSEHVNIKCYLLDKVSFGSAKDSE